LGDRGLAEPDGGKSIVCSGISAAGKAVTAPSAAGAAMWLSLSRADRRLFLAFDDRNATNY